MTYLNNLLHYFIKTSYTYPSYITLIILFIIQVLLVYQLFFKQKVTRDLKVYNFTLNTFYILGYLSIFIILLFTLRYIRWGYTIDLGLLATNISTFYAKVPLIVSMNFFSLIILLFVILLKLLVFLHKEILKRHLYYYYNSQRNTRKKFIEKHPGKSWTQKGYSLWGLYPLYVRICYKLEGKYDYGRYQEKFLFYYILEPLRILLCKDTLSMKVVKYITLFFTLVPQIILIILFTYDCIYNTFNIHLIFYYMPFYFLLSLWISISTFLKETLTSLNNIIYERYYEEHNVKYIGTTEEEDSYIFKYIEQNCKCFIHLSPYNTDDFDIYVDNLEKIFAFPTIFIYNRKYIRVDDTNVFRNVSTGEEVLEENLHETLL